MNILKKLFGKKELSTKEALKAKEDFIEALKHLDPEEREQVNNLIKRNMEELRESLKRKS
jgi:hypothetical protein